MSRAISSAEPFARDTGKAEMKGIRGLHLEVYSLEMKRSEKQQFKVTVAQGEPRVREVSFHVCQDDVGGRLCRRSGNLALEERVREAKRSHRDPLG